MSSISVENFIKVIYKFEQGIEDNARTSSVAKELGITHAAATDMARKLAGKKLIDYEKYKEITLTPSGKKMALNIVRKHRLWETFLHKVFGLTMHEIHREAEHLEHLTSDFLAQKISLFLGHPTTDPHGDPIPNEEGRIVENLDSTSLSSVKAGKYKICRLVGSNQDFFDFCHSNGLQVGTIIEVEKQYLKTGMTEAKIEERVLLLNSEWTRMIFVQK